MKWLLKIIVVVLPLALSFVQWILPGQIENSQNINLPHDRYDVGERALILHK